MTFEEMKELLEKKTYTPEEIEKMVEELKMYKEMDEKGMLIKLPVEPGKEAYFVHKKLTCQVCKFDGVECLKCQDHKYKISKVVYGPKYFNSDHICATEAEAEAKRVELEHHK